jgi:putative membrane protein
MALTARACLQRAAEYRLQAKMATNEWVGVELLELAQARGTGGECHGLPGKRPTGTTRSHIWLLPQKDEPSMKRLVPTFFAGALAFVALPAWSQQTPPSGGNPNIPYPYGPMMWHDGWGWHPGMFLAPFVFLLALIGTVALILWLVRWASGGQHHGWHQHFAHGSRPGPSRAAIDILEERFARGEIDKAEFEEKRKLLGR